MLSGSELLFRLHPDGKAGCPGAVKTLFANRQKE
jgi:hypothetical protein